MYVCVRESMRGYLFVVTIVGLFMVFRLQCLDILKYVSFRWLYHTFFIGLCSSSQPFCQEVSSIVFFGTAFILYFTIMVS